MPAIFASVNPKTPDFSAHLEFLVATGQNVVKLMLYWRLRKSPASSNPTRSAKQSSFFAISGEMSETARSAEERLRFYAEQFNTVEVDSTYYALPAERNAGDSAQFCGECSTSRTR